MNPISMAPIYAQALFTADLLPHQYLIYGQPPAAPKR